MRQSVMIIIKIYLTKPSASRRPFLVGPYESLAVRRATKPINVADVQT